MWPFKKKEDFDIHCSNRTLKSIIDAHFKEVTHSYEYESRTIFLVQDGVKYHKLLNDLIIDAYSRHTPDDLCDIPDYQTFLSLEQSMIDDQDTYREKAVCVEGYIADSLQDYTSEWTRENSGVFIYPMPCKCEIEMKIIYALCDDMQMTESLILVGDFPLPTEKGLHIRVHGVPRFYRTGVERPGKVHILVQKYEIINEGRE